MLESSSEEQCTSEMQQAALWAQEAAEIMGLLGEAVDNLVSAISRTLGPTFKALALAMRGVRRVLRQYSICTQCKRALQLPASRRWKQGTCSWCGWRGAVWRLLD
jgi:hypothetical protein